MYVYTDIHRHTHTHSCLSFEEDQIWTAKGVSISTLLESRWEGRGLWREQESSRLEGILGRVLPLTCVGKQSTLLVYAWAPSSEVHPLWPL